MKFKHVLKKIQKDHGEDVGAIGLPIAQAERCPFGIFALDVAIGGGFPLHRLTLIHGKWSSTKSVLAMCAIREFQRRYPDRQCVYVEPEARMEEKWARRLGVDWDNLAVFRPKYAEQMVDVTYDVLQADDIGLVVTDSIAAASRLTELSKSAEDGKVGGASLAVNEMVRKTTLALEEARKRGSGPAMIWVNQQRVKAGQMFGDPTTLPGGMGQYFMSSLTLALYGKDKVVKGEGGELPCLKEVSVTVQKHGVPILAKKALYDMVVLEHKGLRAGRTNDFPAAKQFASDYGLLAKEGNDWVWTQTGEAFGTLNEWWDWMRGDPFRLDAVRNAVLRDKLPEAFGDEPVPA